jgi:hypothetical protein
MGRYLITMIVCCFVVLLLSRFIDDDLNLEPRWLLNDVIDQRDFHRAENGK